MIPGGFAVSVRTQPEEVLTSDGMLGKTRHAVRYRVFTKSGIIVTKLSTVVLTLHLLQ